MKKTKAQGQNLGELLKRARSEAGASAAAKSAAAAQGVPLEVKSISLTPAALSFLEHLMGEMSKRSGRKVSASSVVRALLRYAEHQVPSAKLVDLMTAELASGEVVWGKRASS